jgi:hypothetical protein
MKESFNKAALIEKMAQRLHCSNCARRYRARDFAFLEERENAVVMRLDCAHCHKKSIVVALIQRRGVHPLYSELEPDEWQRYRHSPAVTRDDVIMMHRTMASYDGDFSDVLEDPLPPDSSEN